MTDTEYPSGWTVTLNGVGLYKPTLLLPNHTCPIGVMFGTEDEAWGFITDVILPRASAKVAQRYVTEDR